MCTQTPLAPVDGYVDGRLCRGTHTRTAELRRELRHIAGKLYKYKEDTSSGQLRVEVYISFGGMLMLLKVQRAHCTGRVSPDVDAGCTRRRDETEALLCVQGDPSHLEVLKLDSRLYLLMRRV